MNSKEPCLQVCKKYKDLGNAILIEALEQDK